MSKLDEYTQEFSRNRIRIGQIDAGLLVCGGVIHAELLGQRTLLKRRQHDLHRAIAIETKNVG